MGGDLVVSLVFVCCLSLARTSIIIKEISGPGSIEEGSTDEAILDCEFDAQNEDDVVVKWFYNGLEEQIYQWITSLDHASASGHLKDRIDTSYRVSKDRNSMYRALRLKDVDSSLSGNYTCKVSSDISEHVKTKQLIVYSPATSFDIYIMEGDEIINCDVAMVSPKPMFDLYILGTNGTTIELPEPFLYNKTENLEGGFYNASITLSFNSSFLPEGSTKFACELSIPGTNYTEIKIVEHLKDDGFTLSEDYPDVFLSSTESTADVFENVTRGNGGNDRLISSLFWNILLLVSLLVAT